jgi:tryptophan-rich sensory protein
MIWDAQSVVALVTWFVFVFWDPLPVSMDEYDMYEKEKTDRLPMMLRFNRMIFPIVWFILQLLLVAFMFLYTQFTINPHNHTFIVVTVLMLFNELVRKTWSAVFFQQKNFIGAFIICLILLGSATPVCALTISGNNIGEDNVTPDNLRWMLFAFYATYYVWLVVALVLNAAWIYDQPQSHTDADVEVQSSKGPTLIIPDSWLRPGRKKMR